MKIIEPYFAPQNKLLWNHYQDLEFPFDSVERPRLKMQIEWNLDQLFDMLRSVSAARLCIEDRGEGFFRTAYSRVKESWGDPSIRRMFEFDTVWLIAR